MTRGERVICVSNTVRDHLLHNYPRTDPAHLIVIPRGVDAEEFVYGYQPGDSWREWFFAEFPQLDDVPLLTLPGRGTRLKGHADAIELVADLKARGISGRASIARRASARVAKLHSRIRGARGQARGVADRLAISAPRDDVRDIYAISALVLQLSKKPESFGRTVIEALALCRPVLGYDHGGVGELLGRSLSGRGASRPAITRVSSSALPSSCIARRRSRRCNAIASPTCSDATLALYNELASS